MPTQPLLIESAMSDPFSVIFIFMGVIVIGMIVFAVWLVATMFRLVGRAFVSLFRWDPMPRGRFGPTRRCPRRLCQAVNPSSARFCRRCGYELLGSEISCHAATW
jgi:hypothetical protein